jgi:drug/metabolite transporter (DMT)-like permease
MPQNNRYLGIALAILATVIWSGNFIVARGVSRQMGPVSLAFYRWFTATIIITPLAWKKFREEKHLLKQHLSYLFWTALTGITVFNTFVYVAGHHTSAINLALIGTTSSPIFSTIMAVVFLKERMNPVKLAGFLLCIAGILVLLSNGSWSALMGFRFSRGDLWVIAAALSFAVYSILVKRKPAGISSVNFLFVIFAGGTAMLLPAYLWEQQNGQQTIWSPQLPYIILYLGAGASVISFLCWNKAIHTLGAARTVLFGNLIPIFSVAEAAIILDEKINTIHLVSGCMVIGGLIIANIRYRKDA